MSTTNKAAKPRQSRSKKVVFGNMYYTADDVQELLGCGKTHAYEIIKNLNAEIQAMGYITVRGKVSKRYFHEKCYLESSPR